MRIVNLMENTPGLGGCVCEHGLSIYVETKKHKLLVDTGASGAFIDNAKKLGIDLESVDTVILSHGHYDHGGGISDFVKINSKAKIYIRPSAFGNYYHKGHKSERYIGLKKELESCEQMCLVEGNVTIDDEIFLFTNVTGRRLWPSGNLKLKKKISDDWVQDDFDHEQYLILSGDGKEVLISGCAHNGILNILDKALELRGRVPDIVISGFHMMQKNGYSNEDMEIIRRTAEILKTYPTKFYTGHCTDRIPYEEMKNIMGDQVFYMHCGDSLNLE